MSGGAIIGISPGLTWTAAEVAAGAVPHRLGEIGSYIDDGVFKEYKFVQYDNATAATDSVAGEVASYINVAGGGFVSNIVTSDQSDTVGMGAGVLQSVIPDGGQGWVQISGPATLSIALTAGTDGSPLTVIGATDGTLDVVAAVTSPIVAYADDASANSIICAFPR